MMDENITEYSQWYAIHTHPKQESRAEQNLQMWNVETFNPLLKKKRREGSWSSTPVYEVKPLFSRYIFARFNVSKMLYKINFTRGIHSVVSFGGDPAPIEDGIIELMKAAQQDDGYIQIGAKLKAGDKVVIKNGPFKNFQGIFERRMNDSERVMILLDTISFQGHISIDQEMVEKIEGNQPD